MIDLGNGYLIKPTSYGYNVVVDRGQKDKETGEPVYYPVSYHGTLASAIAAVMRSAQRDALSKGDYTLEQAVVVLQRMQRDFNKLLEEAISGKERL